MALQIGAFSYSQEDYGTYIYGLPKHQVLWKSTYWNWCRNRKLQTELISDKELQSLQVRESICKQ
jgi:hypothetical protein